MYSLRFSKLHSNGNDFILVDRIAQHVADELIIGNAQHLTDRHTGIGADGIILVDSPQHPDVDFSYRIINASGQEIGQCGNGAICFSHYIAAKDYTSKRTISVEVGGRRMLLTRTDCDTMTLLNMGQPSFIPSVIPCTLTEPDALTKLDVAGHSIIGSAVSMGNPHFVMRVDDTNAALVEEIGLALQQDSRFPEQVNVGFMQIIDAKQIRLRVFERGVGETLSCGSGACAAVLIGHKHGWLDATVTVHTLGGQAQITLDDDGSVYYASRAMQVFSGITKLLHTA